MGTSFGSIIRSIVVAMQLYNNSTTVHLVELGLGVVFSGPGRSADDVISRDIAWFQR